MSKGRPFSRSRINQRKEEENSQRVEMERNETAVGETFRFNIKEPLVIQLRPPMHCRSPFLSFLHYLLHYYSKSSVADDAQPNLSLSLYITVLIC